MAIQSLASLGTGLANRQAFKLHALPDGGVLWLQDELVERFIFYLPLDVVQQRWANALDNSKANGPLRITAGYTQARTPNGACSIEGGTHCISLTRGLVLHLLRICAAAARHPSSFPDLSSDGAVREAPFQPEEWFRWEEEAEQRLFWELAPPNILEAPFRRRLALLLLFDALHVAWLHEAFHVYLGHAGYLRQYRSRLRMTEQMEPAEGQVLDDIVYQALEFEADNTAMRMAVDMVHVGEDPLRLTLAPELDTDRRLGILLMAGCFLTLGWTALERLYNQSSRIHPPPHVRYFTMILAHSDRSDMYIEKDRIIRIQEWVFRQFGPLLGIDAFFEPLARMADKAERTFSDKMTTRFIEILAAQADRLQPYRYAPV